MKQHDCLSESTQKAESLARLPFIIRPDIRQLVFADLREVAPEEEAPDGMLHPPAHLHQVLENVLGRGLLGLDVHGPHRDEKVPEAGGVICKSGQGVGCDSPESLPCLASRLLLGTG